MSPLLMDTGYEPNTPGSVSAEENTSNTAGSEREGEVTTSKGTKRRQKNRDAARKSRKKQTERADELHEELQALEQSNSVLQKEISALRKEAGRYTAILEQHEPRCRLRGSAPSAAATPPASKPPLNPSHVFPSDAPPHSLFSDQPSPSRASITPLLLYDEPLFDALSTEPPPFQAGAMAAPPQAKPEAYHPNSLKLLPQHFAPVTGNTNLPADFTSNPGQQASASGSLLSLLTTPSPLSPLSAPGPAPSPAPSPPTFLGDLDALSPPPPPGDLSFLELLEGNEWILNNL